MPVGVPSGTIIRA